MRSPLKTLRQLGLRPALLYAWYQFQLRSGLLRLLTPARSLSPATRDHGLQPLFDPPSRARLGEVLESRSADLTSEADEILGGQVRLFGADPVPLQLRSPQPLKHWSATPTQLPGGADIKPLWEVGRFGWAVILARAYHLTGNEDYAEAFWLRLEEFLSANPPNRGPHWSSAQEVALRLIHLAFAFTLFATSPATTPMRRRWFAAATVAHAARIPPTLAYARAQNNNHLLSEALGLVTAAALIPAHPRAAAWAGLGWRCFHHGLRAQIHEDGSYAQHSANYQRLLLQLGLWSHLLAHQTATPLPAASLQRLAAATRWQLALLDMPSGGLPNLGPNDGAYLLPLTIQPFSDHRPVLQAAGFAFFGEHPIPPGLWDEPILWLVKPNAKPLKRLPPPKPAGPPLRLQSRQSWAYLRAAHFESRPGHADQLHLDLWWRGLNLALDPGTFLYTTPTDSIWNNALAATRVHNTLTIEGCDQMTPAGRFLWLDWAQAEATYTEVDDVGHLIAAEARHDGYRALGLTHARRVSVNEKDAWRIEDQLTSHQANPAPVKARLHWLLPDWPWQIKGNTLRLKSPHGWLTITINSAPAPAALSLIRSGEILHGDAAPDPILGWHSPTYGLKQPALALFADLRAAPPLSFETLWLFPK